MMNVKQIQDKLRPVLGEKILDALFDPMVTDLECNADGQVWVDTLNAGRRLHGNLDSDSAYNIICTVAGLMGTTVNRQHPDLKGELPLMVNCKEKLLRFQGMLPPIVKNPTITIRVPTSQAFSLDDYVRDGVMGVEQRNYLLDTISSKKTILVIGNTGSGKTTLCNAIIEGMVSRFPLDRIITIEDTFELQCFARNRVALKTSDQLDMEDLLRCSLRMNPDRIIIGEVRGREALSMLKAWNTGHSGICTIHANTALSGLIRIEYLIQEAGIVPVPEVIAQTINVLVYIGRTTSNSKGRIVEEILEVQGFDRDSKKYITRNIKDNCGEVFGITNVDDVFYELLNADIFRRN